MIQVTNEENAACVKIDMLLNGKKVNTVYAYLVDGMLIDTGPQNRQTALIPFYESRTFDLVALTHSHEDHSGLAPWIQKNCHVPVYVHPLGIDICAQDCPYPAYRQIAWGEREAFNALPISDTISSRTLDWEVISTPGHADDHVSFFNKETGRLFSGDLFVSAKTKVVMCTESIPVTIKSIQKLLQYDFGSLYCSHAGYHKNGKELLQKKLDNLISLSSEVRYHHKRGLSIIEIQKKVFPKTYPIIAVSNGEWDSKHIITSILSDKG